jgi:large subunit ribosomal protein L4
LRRDLVSKVFHYYNVKDLKKTHVAKTKGDVAGSGIKPAA